MRGVITRPLGQVLVAVAVALGAGGIYVTQTGTTGGSGQTANLWIDTNGGTCVRQSTAAAYVDAAACSSFTAAYAAASGGDTVQVKAGSYSAFSPSGSKTGRVTFRPATGESVTLASSTFTPTAQSQSKNITLDGFTINGLVLGNKDASGGFGWAVKDVTVQNSNFGTTQAVVFTNQGADLNILFDRNTFGAYNATGQPEGRMSVVWPNGPGSANSGVTVSNSTFGPGGCSDGIQIGSYGVVLDGVTVHDLPDQDTCSALNGTHVDGVQGVGSSHTVIRNSLFYNLELALGFYDGEDHTLVTNSAFRDIQRDDEVVLLSDTPSPTITHNSLGFGCSPGGNEWCGTNLDSDDGDQTTNATVKCNVTTYVSSQPANPPTFLLRDYNLQQSGTLFGAHSISGTPVFAGGSDFTTLAGAALTSGSPGYHACDDGSSMGVVP